MVTDIKSTYCDVAQMVKNLPAKEQTWVSFLGGEDPLERGMAMSFHSCSYRGKICYQSIINTNI